MTTHSALIENTQNSTWRAFETAFETACACIAADRQPFYVLGKVCSRGVQDLHYGEPNPRSRCSSLRRRAGPGTAPDTRRGRVSRRPVPAGAGAGKMQPCVIGVRMPHARWLEEQHA